MPIRFAIDIELFDFPDAPAPDADAVQADVAQGLADIWPALGLPAEPDVSVRRSTEPGDLFDFALRLGGHRAPSPVFRPGVPVAPLAFRILTAIFEQRTRLVTDEHLRLLREQCFLQSKTPPAWSSAPLSMWRGVANLLLENGFGLDRLADCLEHGQAENSPAEAFERHIENLDALTLTVVLRPEIADDPDRETRFAALYEQAYQDLGIVLPQIRLETADNLPAGHFRLRLNDLWVPVQPGADLDEVLNGVRYQITRHAAWYVNTSLVESLMDSLEENNRSLIVMTREQWPTQRLCAVLRLLLLEQVSIRNLSEILDVLLRLDGTLAVDETQYLSFFAPVSRVTPVAPGMPDAALTDAQLAGQVRASLRYPIVFPHLQNGLLPCYRFAPHILRDLREGFFDQTEPQRGTAWHALLQAIAAQTAEDWPKAVLLAPTGIRPAAAAVLRPYFPEMVVLGLDEVPPIFATTAKATID